MSAPARLLVRTAIAMTALVTVGGCGYFVWPTPWRYDRSDGVPIRISRANGDAEALCPDGWHSLKPDPFSDIADRPQTPDFCAVPNRPSRSSR
jgi:hypothetical protein